MLFNLSQIINSFIKRFRKVPKIYENFPKNSEQFRIVPKSSEKFRIVPKSSEKFRKVPKKIRKNSEFGLFGTLVQESKIIE